MTALADACADYAAAVPLAEALIHIPDTDGTSGRGQPSSRPPWNQAAADALLGALEGARQIEAAWRSQAAGRPVPRRPMSMTGMVLKSLLRLAEALPPCPPREYDEKNRPLPCRCARCTAIRDLTRWMTAILQLPAVDQAERPLRVAALCPYCGTGMLRVFPRSGRVTCLLAGAPCADADGNPPAGLMGRSALDGSPVIAWADGLVT